MDPRLFTDQLLSAFMARDLPAVLAMFEDDAVVVTDLYPESILSCLRADELEGKEAKGADIVEEAARHGLRVAAHAHGTDGIKAAVNAGVASIEHGSLLDDEAIALMKSKGTYLVPTAYLRDQIDLDALPGVTQRKARWLFPLAQKSLEKAIAGGVKIAFGTDAGVYPHGQNAREFAVLVRAGMKPADAIRAATLSACDLLGVPPDLLELEKLIQR